MMLLDEIERIYNDLIKIREELKEKETKINHLYHILEVAELNACQLAKLMKILRVSLKDRRALKNRMRYTQSLVSCLPTVESLKDRLRHVAKKEQEDNARYMQESISVIHTMDILK